MVQWGTNKQYGKNAVFVILALKFINKQDLLKLKNILLPKLFLLGPFTAEIINNSICILYYNVHLQNTVNFIFGNLN